MYPARGAARRVAHPTAKVEAMLIITGMPCRDVTTFMKTGGRKISTSRTYPLTFFLGQMLHEEEELGHQREGGVRDGHDVIRHARQKPHALLALGDGVRQGGDAE